MTDYDHWPAIRFRFSGDVEQAKGRIPQARTLMAQLIRRMEGQERDTGQWQGQLSDGTQFRVAKIGDVHVADIFGVSPSVESQRPMRNIIPVAPEFAQRDILMRPHGERFGEGSGDYLWIGARVLGPAYSALAYPTGYKRVGSSTTTTTWRETPGPTGTWIQYRGPSVGDEDYRFAGWYRIPIQRSDNTELVPVYVSSPTVNLALFAPDAKDRVPGSIIQGGIGELFHQTTQPYFAELWRMEYNGFSAVWWNTQQSLSNPRGWVIQEQDQQSYQYPFANLVWSERNIYSSTLISKKDSPIDVHGYLCMDAKDQEKTRANFYLPVAAPTNLGTGLGVLPRYYLTDLPADITTSGEPEESTVISYYDGPLLISESECQVIQDDPVSVQATADDIFSGFYELRVSAGFSALVRTINENAEDTTIDVSAWQNVQCEVYIQLGDALQTYTVTLNATNSYVDTKKFIDRGSSYDGPGTIGGLFDARGWIEEGKTTPMDDTWYPGCWLIDIRNQTIIHETNPAKLTRDWFSQ